MAEVWRDIAGVPNYQVSDFGRVRSVSFVLVCGCRWGGLVKKHIGGRIIKPFPAGKGYFSVKLGAKTPRRYVHRLVAAAFVPNLAGLSDVNHRNGNKTDNRATNLEWVTKSQNRLHAHHVLGRRGGEFKPGGGRHAAGANA